MKFNIILVLIIAKLNVPNEDLNLFSKSLTTIASQTKITEIQEKNLFDKIKDNLWTTTVTLGSTLFESFGVIYGITIANSILSKENNFSVDDLDKNLSDQIWANTSLRKLILDHLIIKDCKKTETHGLFQKYVYCVDEKSISSLIISPAVASILGYCTTNLILDTTKKISFLTPGTKNALVSGLYGFAGALLNFVNDGSINPYLWNTVTCTINEGLDSLVKEFKLLIGLKEGFSISIVTNVIEFIINQIKNDNANIASTPNESVPTLGDHEVKTNTDL